MKTCTIRQIDLKDGCKHVELHTFPFPDFLDAKFYRSSISYSAFFESGKHRNRSERYLFSVLDLRHGDFRSEHELNRDNALPVAAHAGLLDFFKAIGYNPKTKSFHVTPN
jgi:hypothetical protein